MDEMQVLAEVAQTVGMWAIFAGLFVHERRAHEDTRQVHREDLREIAGMRQNIRGNSPGRTSTEVLSA